MEGKFESPIKRRKRVQGKYLDGKMVSRKLDFSNLNKKLIFQKKIMLNNNARWISGIVMISII